MPIIFVNPGSNVLNIKFSPESDPTFMDRVYLEMNNMIEKVGMFYIFIDMKGMTLTYLSKNRKWLEQTVKTPEINKYYEYLVEVRIFNAPFITRQILSILSKCIVDIKKKVKFIK